jgi:hypothetical protein
MEELGRSLREAFEREQAGLGSLAGARDRVMSTAIASRRASPGRALRLAGGAVALLLTAAVVGTLLLARSGATAQPAHSRPTAIPTVAPTPSSPPSTPTPGPATAAVSGHQTQALAVPSSEPVLLFRDGDDPSQVDGVTWDGGTAGRVGQVSSQSGILQNPPGTRYAVTSGLVYDRSGAQVGTAPPARDPWRWADDGGGYCHVDQSATLTLGGVGPAVHTVTRVGTTSSQTGLVLAACSVESDRAVVVQTAGQGVSAAKVSVVQLSSGSTIWARSLPNDGTSTVRVNASRDGQYVAVISSRCCLGAAPGPSSTTIYGPDGAVAGQVAGAVEAFSWDGTLAVVSGPVVSVVRWRNGATIWNAPAGVTYVSSLPEPGGQQVAVAVHDPSVPQTGGFPPYDLYAVGLNGQARLLVRGVTS